MRIRWQRWPLYAVALIGGLLSPSPSPAFGQIGFIDITDSLRVALLRGGITAVGDYNNDGRPDAAIGGSISLLENLCHGRFADRTATVLPGLSGRENGALVFGDYDNDGDRDLFLAARGPNALLRNDKGVFVDVTVEAGLTDSLNSKHAIWFDYDRDGYLDLYWANLDRIPREGTDRVSADRNRLFRNLGDGTFTDVTAAVGLDVQLQEDGGADGGMVAADFNNDGWPDIYVGVRGRRNRLFLSDGTGQFVDTPIGSHDDQSFGVAVGDVNNDGLLDILQASGGAGQDGGVASLAYRSELLLNLGAGEFIDITASALNELQQIQVHEPAFGDFDNDGDLDLVISSPFMIFANDAGVFSDVSESAGGATGDWGLGTVSLFDVDNDGHLDIWSQGLLSRNLGNDNHWLRVHLTGERSNRDGVGARLLLHAGGVTQVREVLAGKGLSQSEIVAHFGLGTEDVVERLEIRWPSGTTDVIDGIAADQTIRVIEGRGALARVEQSRFTGLTPALISERSSTVSAIVQPALFEPGAQITRVTADLTGLGGHSDVALEAQEDGSFRLAHEMVVRAALGSHPVSVLVEQSTSLGDVWTRLTRDIAVVPGSDETIFADAGHGWAFFGELGTNITRHPALDWRPDWSSVEDRIVFTSARGGNSDIYAMDGDGGNLERLTTDDRPDYWATWSPDGTKIAFGASVGPGGSQEVLVMDADGGNQRQLTNEPNKDYATAWSPDGTKILFYTGRDGNDEVYVMNADGSGVRNLSNSAQADQRAQWSPDGTKIAFNSDRAVEPDSDGNRRGNDIFIMDADGSNQVQLTNTPEREILGDWSPDGRRIVYEGEVDVLNGQRDIFVIDADGSNRINITNHPAPDREPTWSPDGTRVAFVSGRDGNADIYVLDLEDVTPVDDGERANVFEGSTSMRVEANGEWELGFRSGGRFDVTGYTALQFAFHPGTLAITSSDEFFLELERPFLGRPRHDLLAIGDEDTSSGVDLTLSEWQTVRIPLHLLGPLDPISEVRLAGNLTGSFFIDEVHLVAAKLSDFGETETAVVEQPGEGTPDSFDLSQNYPNPFNPNTTIRFDLPSSGDVDLAVYNMAGQRVVELVSGLRQAGSYSVRWEGKDDAGRDLASGMYLYRLVAGDFVRTKKLMLLR